MKPLTPSTKCLILPCGFDNYTTDEKIEILDRIITNASLLQKSLMSENEWAAAAVGSLKSLSLDLSALSGS